MTFFNTTQETPKQVQMFATKSNCQDQEVLTIAKRLQKFSASIIYKQYPISNVPITSIRRSINSLMKNGKIEATGNKVEGIYGRSEKQYKVI